MDGSGPSLVPQFLLIIVLTMINAFFASAEMAAVSCNRNKINNMAESGDKSAAILIKLLKDQTRFLSTIQVGITFAGFLSSASTASTISQRFADVLNSTGVPYATTWALIIVTVILSYLTLVFGELVPKRIALTNSEVVALKSAKVIAIASKVTYPFVKLLSVSTTIVLKMLGKYSEDVEEKISEEELKSYIKVSQEQGVINLSGEEMIVNIMDFDDKMAYEIMTARPNIYMIDVDEFSEDKIPEIIRMGYSRLPVYRENTDNIIGTLYIKDMFREYSKTNYTKVDLKKCIKKPYFVPETKKIDQLLKELQNTKNYVAILIDEYGGFSGMVTVEDIVEEIVGEIEDEYDTKEPRITKVDKNTYIIDGSMEIDTINDELGINLFSENHETISGLMMELLGFIPEEDQKNLSVIYEGRIKLKELFVEDKTIAKIELTVLESE